MRAVAFVALLCVACVGARAQTVVFDSIDPGQTRAGDIWVGQAAAPGLMLRQRFRPITTGRLQTLEVVGVLDDFLGVDSTIVQVRELNSGRLLGQALLGQNQAQQTQFPDFQVTIDLTPFCIEVRSPLEYEVRFVRDDAYMLEDPSIDVDVFPVREIDPVEGTFEPAAEISEDGGLTFQDTFLDARVAMRLTVDRRRYEASAYEYDDNVSPRSPIGMGAGDDAIEQRFESAISGQIKRILLAGVKPGAGTNAALRAEIVTRGGTVLGGALFVYSEFEPFRPAEFDFAHACVGLVAGETYFLRIRPLAPTGFDDVSVDVCYPTSSGFGNYPALFTFDGGTPNFLEQNGAYGLLEMNVLLYDDVNAGPECVPDLTTVNTNPGETGYGAPDGAVDGADLSYFIESWLAGCP